MIKEVARRHESGRRHIEVKMSIEDEKDIQRKGGRLG